MEYEKMLDQAYSLLPEKSKKKERFEVPAVECLVQGNKTIIRNFDFIAQTLRRNPQLLAKYLFKELAIRGDLEGGRLILHRRFNDKVLNERIHDFVKNYVLCRECGKPDTTLEDLERGVKMMICEACGARHPVKMI